MTQKELDSLVEMWVMCMDMGTNGFRLRRSYYEHNGKVEVFVIHDDICKIDLPSDYVLKTTEPKDITKKVYELLDQIYKYGDQWLQDEKDYHADKLAEKWDDERKNDLEN